MSWLDKLSFSSLRRGLGKTAANLGHGLKLALTGKRLDAAMCDALEEALITTDMGVTTATAVVETLRSQKFGEELDEAAVRAMLAETIETRLTPVAQPLTLAPAKPAVVLMVGVNGAGKTTTIGKLAAQLKADGKKVMLAAGDTYRAAAVEQLQAWGNRIGVTTIAPEKEGTDAAALLYTACQKAEAEGVDVLLADTAGRLQNRQDLMAQLEKIVRVLKKFNPDAPHTTLLVLDATVGQNAHQQVDVFRQIANVTGLVVTKLDGSAKAGVVVALAEKYGLPIHFLGVGEGVDDLRPFDAKDFAKALVGA